MKPWLTGTNLGWRGMIIRAPTFFHLLPHDGDQSRG